MMVKSPCRSCELLHADKRNDTCEQCDRRIAYLLAIEYGPQCREDPCYAASCSLPRSFERQIGPADPWSQHDPVLPFL